MKKYSVLCGVFLGLAVLLSDIMCAVVAYQYCDMLYGIEYRGYSAPAEVAFFLAIPYLIGIVLCLIAAGIFYRKRKNS